MLTNKQSTNNPFSSLSLWFLLFSNLVTIYFAISQNWNLTTIMLVYWFQSIIIGFFNFIRILQLKDFSLEGVENADQLTILFPSKRAIKIFAAFFFLFHFGFFHFGYLLMISMGSAMKTLPKMGFITTTHTATANPIDKKYIVLAVLLFFVNHLFSYIYNRPRDTKKQKISSLMSYPYARIIPMHLTILFGPLLQALPLFLILKTLADAIMHYVEHNILRKGEEQ